MYSSTVKISKFNVNNTAKFHYAKYDDIPDGSVILPTIICNACKTEVSEFWITECNACGSTLGDSKRVWNPKNKELKYLVLDDPKLIEKYQSEATWLCINNIGHGNPCLCLNNDSSDICSNIICMADRKEHGVTIPKYQVNDVTGFATPSEVLLPRVGVSKINLNVSTAPKSSELFTPTDDEVNLKIFGGIIASIIAIFATFFALTPTDVSGTIVHYNWHTNIRVEHQVTTRSSDWSTPIGAYNVSYSSQIKSYDKVQTGSHTESVSKTRQVVNGSESYDCSSTSGATIVKNTCSRNTYTTESYNEDVTIPDYSDVPVYADYYTFDIDSMEFYKNVSNDGQDSSPTYPVYTLNPGENTSNSCSASIEVKREEIIDTVNVPSCETITQYQPNKVVTYKHNRANNNWAPKLN